MNAWLVCVACLSIASADAAVRVLRQSGSVSIAFSEGGGTRPLTETNINAIPVFLSTGSNTSVDLEFPGGGRIRIQPESNLKIESVEQHGARFNNHVYVRRGSITASVDPFKAGSGFGFKSAVGTYKPYKSGAAFRITFDGKVYCESGILMGQVLTGTSEVPRPPPGVGEGTMTPPKSAGSDMAVPMTRAAWSDLSVEIAELRNSGTVQLGLLAVSVSRVVGDVSFTDSPGGFGKILDKPGQLAFPVWIKTERNGEVDLDFAGTNWVRLLGNSELCIIDMIEKAPTTKGGIVRSFIELHRGKLICVTAHADPRSDFLVRAVVGDYNAHAYAIFDLDPESLRCVSGELQFTSMVDGKEIRVPVKAGEMITRGKKETIPPAILRSLSKSLGEISAMRLKPGAEVVKR